MDTVTRHAAGAWLRAAVLLVVGIPLGLVTVSDLAAQENQAQKDGQGRIVPTNHAVLTGYGTAGWFYRSDDENAFTASFNPIFLYQFLDRFLFEVEFEFELQGGVTETGLEYAQLDYVATDNLTLVAGKFLLPFNVFGDRLHPTWINKFPTAPPIYGHHVADFGAEPLLPILSDVGVMARGSVAPGRWLLSANVYGVQGPAIEEHEEEEGGEGEDEEELLELEFPGSSSDNNKNKALGVRLDFALPPWVEVNFSFLNGDYDDQGVLDFTAYGVAAEMHRGGFEARGEFIQTRQEIETETGFPSVVRNGFYAQAAYRLGSWEPVFRWTQIFDTELEGEKEDDGARQAAFGLDYWFSPSIALMAGYELNTENGLELDNNRFIIHMAFGF
jgi:hypothetical protein